MTEILLTIATVAIVTGILYLIYWWIDEGPAL